MAAALDARDRLIEAAETGELDRICDALGVDLFGVFGSVLVDAVDVVDAVDAGTEPGDLDVAVRFERGAGDVLAVIDALTELTGYERFDVVDLDRAGPVARKEALFGLGLYERTAGAWAVAQMSAYGEWRDTAHLRRLDLEAMAE